MKLTDNFSYKEFFVSKDHPDVARVMFEHSPAWLKIPLYLLCQELMQPIRDTFGRVKVTSGYRNFVLNNRVSYTDHSLHMDGIACDFVCENMEAVFEYAKTLNVGQLILYRVNGKPRNIHISLPALGHNQLIEVRDGI